ncbi:hypothetical protein Btru_049931 [Bulinus truncatus]|nr:hypothetical protein Btru_049931 [Bulinus truncatus]
MHNMFDIACGDKQKRDIYDRYGKEGIINGAHRGDEDFNFEPSGLGAFHFQFRSPEEIFRDFFGTDDPFASFFVGFPHGSFSSSFFSQVPFASSGPFCAKYETWFAVLSSFDDVHCNERYRVIGSVSNSRDFGAAFNCPLNSPMNPERKCEIW